MSQSRRVGFLGCGAIGGAMVKDLLSRGQSKIAFVQVSKPREGTFPYPVITAVDENLLRQTDLVVESATADVLRAHFDQIIRHCDLMCLSATVFSDPDFERHARELARRYGHRIYLAHGAILGVDGIVDGQSLLTEVSVVTTKSPKSLGRTDTERTIVYDGPTRGACAQFPRNVNVHATVALAGLGFDRTRSVIVSDPAVTTNAHVIEVEGEGIHFRMEVSSFSTGGVTGKYTPYSACASLARVLGEDGPYHFI